MKIHTVFITHNRLELTKKAIGSYISTVTVPYTVWVVDNASTDGTRMWLMRGENCGISLLNENRYPGFACNVGWSHAPADADFLHRADNDFEFLPGWCEEVARIFENRKVGQVGLRTDAEEMFTSTNVGGNCVIRRSLWDAGLRYDERTWPEIQRDLGPGYSEDSIFSPAVRAMHSTWRRVQIPCIRSLASGDLNDPYYQKSYGDRGINPQGREEKLGIPE